MNKISIFLGQFFFGAREDAAEFYSFTTHRTLEPNEPPEALFARMQRNVERDLILDRLWLLGAVAVLVLGLTSGVLVKSIGGGVGWTMDKINSFQRERLEKLYEASQARIDAAREAAQAEIEKERSK